MEFDNQKKILVKCAYYAVMAVLAYLALAYLWRLVLPLLAGFIIAYMLRPATNFLMRHSKVSRRIAAIECAIVFYLILGFIFWIAGGTFVLKIQHFFSELPILYQNFIEPRLSDLNDNIVKLVGGFFPNISNGEVYSSLNDALQNIAISMSSWCMRVISDIFKAMPVNILTLVFTIFSSVLICADYDMITAFIMRQIPSKWHSEILDIRNFLARSIQKVIKAYAILILITFAILWLGLWLIKIGTPWLFAIIIAVVDLLPVIGSGSILIPWAIFLIISGNKFAGISMIVLWVILTVVREVLEPKILGGQIGLHPLITLTAMYLGLKLAGLPGLILAPILCLLVCYLQNNNLINIYK